MWGIAIILIGGIYWTYRVINEKTNEEVLERYRNNADEINNKIKATLDEEISIRKKLKDIGTRWIMLDSISDDLTKIYGSDWRTYFQDDSKFESEYSDIYSSWGKAYHLSLSKIGKIPRLFAETYPLGGVGEERMQYIIKACRCIEKNINVFFPELKMMFVPGKVMSDVDTVRFYDELYMGKIYWKHNIPPRHKRWTPEIKALW